MMTTGWLHGRTGWKRRRVILPLLGPLLLSSCAAAPFLVPIAFEFARNLFQTGLQNYGSKHRDNLSNLVGRLANPYIQGLPPTAMGQPGMPTQPGFGQPGFPAQPGMGQQQFPGQPAYPGQTVDPNNPYGNPAAAYPGSGTYPGATTNPYGGAQAYPSQPAQSGAPYDPNNPYGSGAVNPYGQPAAPYGGASQPYGQPPMNPYGGQSPQASGQYGASSPYGQPANQYGTQNPYGAASPYGGASMPGQPPIDPNNPYASSSAYGQPANPYGTATSPSVPGQAPNPYGTQNPYGVANPYGAAPAQPSYDPNNPYGGGAASQGYGQPPGHTPAYGSATPYGTQPAPPSYDPNNPYGAAASPGSGQPYGQPPAYGASPYGTQPMQPAQPSAGSPYGQPPQYGQQPYGAAGIYPRSVAAEPVAVDVALIRQKQAAKGKEVVLMNDGEVLHDGGPNKEAGDRFKIVVRTNCDCYLYLLSIDGSSWAEPIFPVKDGKTTNPVVKDQEYAFPEGGHWYTLDQVKGIESFFIVASAHRRTDLEETFAQVAAEKRPEAKIVAKVEEAPVIPRGVGSVKTRGILKVQDDTGTAVTVTPLSYAASQAGQDVTVTRWFKHE